jgi:hypothetical protein
MRIIRPSRRRRGLLGALFAVALVATACDFTEWDTDGAYREWYCDPTDTEVNDGHGAGHVGHEFPYTEPKGPLSAEHCFNLDFQLTITSQFAAMFPTKAIAEANGWHWLAPWIPGQGTHHVWEATGVTSTFDPLQPTMLMFDGNNGNAPLTGMVWTVSSGHMPPPGFSGDNDHWHSHQMLCYTDDTLSFIVGDGITDAECASRTGGDGVNVDSSGTWLVHVWLPVYDGWLATDIFNKEHPGI